MIKINLAPFSKTQMYTSRGVLVVPDFKTAPKPISLKRTFFYSMVFHLAAAVISAVAFSAREKCAELKLEFIPIEYTEIPKEPSGNAKRIKQASLKAQASLKKTGRPKKEKPLPKPKPISPLLEMRNPVTNGFPQAVYGQERFSSFFGEKGLKSLTARDILKRFPQDAKPLAPKQKCNESLTTCLYEDGGRTLRNPEFYKPGSVQKSEGTTIVHDDEITEGQLKRNRNKSWTSPVEVCAIYKLIKRRPSALYIFIDSSDSMDGFNSTAAMCATAAAESALKNNVRVSVINFAGRGKIYFSPESSNLDKIKRAIAKAQGGGTFLPSTADFELMVNKDGFKHILLITDGAITNYWEARKTFRAFFEENSLNRIYMAATKPFVPTAVIPDKKSKCGEEFCDSGEKVKHPAIESFLRIGVIPLNGVLFLPGRSSL